LLKGDVRRTVDTTLAPGAPEANCKWLIGVGIDGPKHKDRAGIPLPAGSKISAAFAKAGLIYMLRKSGQLKPTSPRPLEIMHPQVVAKYEEYKKKDPRLTKTQLSENIAIFFNNGSDVSRGYLRKAFDSLDDPLATKKGVFPNAVATTPARDPPAQLPPIEESGESGENGESGKSKESGEPSSATYGKTRAVKGAALPAYPAKQLPSPRLQSPPHPSPPHPSPPHPSPPDLLT
jgi:hypothetical protein